ncbi:hypothetical protein PsorP6_011560 [Peronosclerospora sorghi]|uniref:Uncharacterized protein n=1 Tax=Peronosclerospora sorghi TaxID=230839 RepID=A0ACC0WKP2_9STRA|nr:hypothetical protein PsorP6_011560 [Peronosclerospora sorghi]
MHQTKPVFQIATYLLESNVCPTINNWLVALSYIHPLDEALYSIVRHENFRFSTEGYRQVDTDVRKFHVFLKMPQRLRIYVETFHSMWLDSIESVKSFSFLHVVSDLEMGSPTAPEDDSLA